MYLTVPLKWHDAEAYYRADRAELGSAVVKVLDSLGVAGSIPSPMEPNS